MPDCKVCEKEGKFAFEALILGKHPVNFYGCKNCGLVFCENIHWKDEAADKKAFEKNVLKRNIHLWQLSANIISAFFDTKGKFLDLSPDKGILCRLMRDSGFNFYFSGSGNGNIDGAVAPGENIFAKGFEAREEDDFELICAFNRFEKAEFVLFELEKMLGLSKNILFNAKLLGKKLPGAGNNDFWEFDRGENVTFYSKKTLKFLAKKYRLKLYSHKNIHLLTQKRFGGLKFKAKMKTFDLKQKLMLKLLCVAPH